MGNANKRREPELEERIPQTPRRMIIIRRQIPMFQNDTFNNPSVVGQQFVNEPQQRFVSLPYPAASQNLVLNKNLYVHIPDISEIIKQLQSTYPRATTEPIATSSSVQQPLFQPNEPSAPPPPPWEQIYADSSTMPRNAEPLPSRKPTYFSSRTAPRPPPRTTSLGSRATPPELHRSNTSRTVPRQTTIRRTSHRPLPTLRLNVPPVNHADHEWTDAANSQNQLSSEKPVENKRQTEISSTLRSEANAARDPKVLTHNCPVCDKHIKITKGENFGLRAQGIPDVLVPALC
ncbi:hypothetical protein ACOME3_007390 [Neoechinorhynchus agilis]